MKFRSFCRLQKNVLLGICFLLSASTHAQDFLDTLQARTFQDASGVNLPYRLYVPENYDPNQKYPLVLYLHGSVERGDDNRLPLEAEPFAQTFFSPDVQAAHPSFFLVPQCPWEVVGGDPRGEFWSIISRRSSGNPLGRRHSIRAGHGTPTVSRTTPSRPA